LTFGDKSKLSTHQKTKKCLVHRDIGFICQKCFQNIKGYDNTLKHVSECNENISDDLGMVTALINQLSLRFEVDLNFDNNKGTINLKKMNNYIHPEKLDCGVSVPQRAYLFYKTLVKLSDNQIMGSHNDYLNSVDFKIIRLTEAFQFQSVKYGFEDLLKSVWFSSGSHRCFQLKDDTVYILGKIQCQNNEGQKWFGDTFNLKKNEKIVKCVWYRDPQLKQFFALSKSLLKDLLNLYLNLGNWALKQKKIKFTSTSSDLNSKYKTIVDVMVEYNFLNLVENIKKLDSYETFHSTFKNLLNKDGGDNHVLSGRGRRWGFSPIVIHDNVQHIFKDEDLPSPWVSEEFSLMTLNNPEYVGGNYYYLMDYILPESEKAIFRSKE
jgi:hypothetical protein